MTYIYIGDGTYVPGVPARNLTDEEWAALSDEEKAAAKPLYEPAKAPKKGGE